MTFSYEKVTPSVIADAVMQKRFIDGVHKQYLITPDEGYLLHDSRLDTNIDIEGNPIDPALPGFTASTITVSANYDFDTNPNNIYTKRDKGEENV